ncbi:MAG: pilus assembly protein N-terminal domain-containing protein [Rickettsiales bacterium]
MRTHIAYYVFVFCIMAAACCWGADAAADAVRVTVGANRSAIVRTPSPVSEFTVTDRSVATITKYDPYTVSVIGQRVGSATIRLLHKGRVVRQIAVRVVPNVPSLKAFIGKIYPYEEIEVRQLNGALALVGFVSDAEVASNIKKLAESYLSDASGRPQARVINLLKIYSGQQVMLVAKIGEIRKNALEDLGLGGRAFVNLASGVMGELERSSAFRTLAEPKLTAISGESADFLAGGEFPVPVAGQNGVNAVSYKPFGIQLHFTPLVLSENRIRVNVDSEISDVVEKKGLKALFSGPSMPVFNTRRAKTVVELASGESFMIAGLISNEQALAGYNTVPGVDEIPVFKALLSSTAFRNKESELVIAVTPYIVHPLTSGEVAYPTDHWRAVTTVDSLMHNQLIVPRYRTMQPPRLRPSPTRSDPMQGAMR